jgi:hypothetical protein
MSRCIHGIFLPKNPKYGAKDVCIYCKEGALKDTSDEVISGQTYLTPNLSFNIVNDNYEIMSTRQLLKIFNDPQFDFTVKDYVEEELERRNVDFK